MLVVFIIWTFIAILFIILAVYTKNQKKPVGFFANQEAPKVTNIKEYNKAVSKIWIAYSILFEIFGIPILFCKQNSPLAIITIIGVVFLTIGTILVYTNIANKFAEE